MDIILYILLWYISGVACFIFWWTSEYDLDVSDFLVSLFVGFIGPIAFIVGYFLHGKKHKSFTFTIMHKRK